jgi:leucyl aminopeptidase
MILSPTASVLSLVSAPPSEIDTELLIFPIFEEEGADDVDGLEAATAGHIRRALSTGELRGRPYEVFLTQVSGWKASRIALVGAGRREDFSTERLRRVATVAALAARARRITRIAWLIRGDIPAVAAVQASAEGLGLSAFSIDRYKSAEKAGPPAEEILVVVRTPVDRAVEAALERGRVLADSCNIARELCNEPSNVLTPRELASRATAIVAGTA